ncbi:MAG: cyclase family protein [Chlamydiales bacterium]
MTPDTLRHATFVDLTHTLDDRVPTWSGGCGFQQEIKLDYDQGLRVLQYKMHAGVGTHIDAPTHFFENGMHVADLPLEQLITPMYHIDMSKEAGPDFLLSKEAIIAFEKRVGKIEKGSAVLLSTSWSKRWHDSRAYRNPDASGRMHFPGFSSEAADLLVEREVAGIGIDTLSPDGTNNGFPVHEKILGTGRYILENLFQLEKVPAQGAFLIALPLKIREGTESAVRAVAVLLKR